MDIAAVQSNRWFVIQTFSGKEEKVKNSMEKLLNDDIPFIFPKRKLKIRKGGEWHENIKPLFPGYFFVEGEEYLKEIEARRKYTKNFIRILSEPSTKTPVSLYTDEVERITNIMNTSQVVDHSNVFFEGNNIQIIDGPLKRLVGLIIKVNKRKFRCKVRIPLLGREVLTDLSFDLIERI